MKRSNRLVILVGVLLAVLAFVGIVVVLQGGGGGGTTAEPTTVKVIVAARDLALGEPVAVGDVEVIDVDPAAVVGTRIADASAIPPRPLLYPISAGAQIPQEAFGGITECISCQLEPGEKAIAFQVDRVTGLNFLIQAGDRIDIVLAEEVTPLQETQDSIDARANDPTLQPRFEALVGVGNVRTVKTILQDRRVLYVSGTNIRQIQTGTPTEGEQAPAAEQTTQTENVIIVFAGSDQDAEVIKFSQRDLTEVGKLTAILRRTQDTDEEVPNEQTTGITLDLLIDQYGIPLPGIIIAPPQESPAP